MKQPLVLCILDGFGYNPDSYGNAIAAAKKPNLERLFATCPHTYIGASGMDVGLPDGQMGNSEVGHTNIGAGRVVYQELTRITKSIADGDFFQNEALVGAVQNALDNGTALHLIGLMSDGGVHSHNSHVWAIVKLAKDMGLQKVYLHCLMDGRDVPPTSGADFLTEAQAKLQEIGVGKIATVMGRYYAMDRDNRWERVEKAYAAMVYGEGNVADDPVAAVRKSYTEIDAEGISRMSLSCRLFAKRMRPSGKRTALCSLISVLTERGRLPVPLLTPILTALSVKTGTLIPTMYA